MVNNAAAQPSVDVLGLVLVTTTIEADPRSDFQFHGPTHEVEQIHWLTEADASLTLGQLVARYGLDEGDRIVVRFATLAEERAQLAKVINALPPDPSLHRWDAPKPSALRDADGMLVADPDAHLGATAEA